MLARGYCQRHYKKWLRHGDPLWEKPPRRRPPDYREQRARLHAEKRARLDAIKVERGCDECGFNRHPAALCFHHRDPAEKAFGVAQNLARAWDTVMAEIAKCQLLCANCHAIHTAEWASREITGREHAARSKRKG